MNRQVKDLFFKIVTYCASSIGIMTFIAILIFVFSKGYKVFNIKLFTSDYHPESYTLESEEFSFEDPFISPKEHKGFFSEKWGFVIEDTIDLKGEKIVIFSYIDLKSPLKKLKLTHTKEFFQIEEDLTFENATLKTEKGGTLFAFSVDKAEIIRDSFEKSNSIELLRVNTQGGGIRGSLISTLYLVLLTLILVIPLGISVALYLREYAKENRFMNLLRRMIEMLTGVPSIIFGLIGATIFVPLTMKILNASTGNIISGALTMTIVLLPVVIKSTEEALKVIPNDLRTAALALGSNKYQMIFKIVLPNALPGIMTACMLSIGRIIGESAALVYAMGTSIQDNIRLNGPSTTLATQIFVIMGLETPNFQLASAISILILLVVLILNLIVKWMTFRMRKKFI